MSGAVAPGTELVVFSLDDRRYALALPAVERVVRIVDITPLPGAPEIVLGVVNVQGRVVPVINLRRRFRLPERDIALTDQLIIAHSARRPLALVSDGAHGVVSLSDADVVAFERVVPGLEYVEGIVKMHDGLILIHDLDRFLALEEDAALEKAMTDA